MFLFRRQDFCYDHLTSQPLQICFSYIRLCNFNWSACVTSSLALSVASFLFIFVIKFLVTRDFPHSKVTSSLWNWLRTLIQRDKVKWMRVTLNKGYLIAATRGSNNLYRFFIKNCNILSLQWKDFFGLSLFTVFWDCRFTNLLRLFSGNLAAMFAVLFLNFHPKYF